VSIASTTVLDYIRSYIGQHGYGPTIREVAARFDTATSNAHRHVEKLARQGKIVRTRNRARSIRLPAAQVSQET
jgi:SOS-response transcriptional repressor LexA